MGGKCCDGSGVHAGATPDGSIGIERHIPLSSGAMIFPDHFIVPFVISNIVGFDTPIKFYEGKKKTTVHTKLTNTVVCTNISVE